jgi:hypothetical protein
MPPFKTTCLYSDCVRGGEKSEFKRVSACDICNARWVDEARAARGEKPHTKVSLTSPVQIIRRERNRADEAIRAARRELLALEARLGREDAMGIARTLRDTVDDICDSVARLDIAQYMASTTPASAESSE